MQKNDNDEFKDILSELAGNLSDNNLMSIIDKLEKEVKQNNTDKTEQKSTDNINDTEQKNTDNKPEQKSIDVKYYDDTNNTIITEQNSIEVKPQKRKLKVKTTSKNIEKYKKLMAETDNENKEHIDNSNKELAKLKDKIDKKTETIEKGLIEINKKEKQLKKQNEFIETQTSDDPLKAMEAIASNPNYTEALLKYTDPKVSENQFKLFIIAQCKREMYKVLEYSKFLDKLEERFKQVYIDRIDELSDGLILHLMKVVLERIDRANELINSVIKDKEITNVLVINQQNNNINSISDLTKDKLLKTLYKASEDKAESASASRAKVVEVVTDILKDIDKNDENSLDEIVKSPEELNNEEIDKALAELQKQPSTEGMEIIDATDPDNPIIIQPGEENK